MEYERIHKVQTGFISPTKLRMKLTGSNYQKKKDGSNCNSSRTSPSRLEDSEFVKSSLLGSDDDGVFLEEVSSIEDPPTTKSENSTSKTTQGEPEDTGRPRTQSVSKGDNSSSVHPIRSYEDENLDYDSTSSFEFHKGDQHQHKSLHHSITRSLSRPMSSKWNDAEKWIINRAHHNPQSNNPKRTNLQSQGNRLLPLSGPSVKRVDFAQPPKFGFVSNGSVAVSGQVNGNNSSIDDCPESKDLPCTKTVTEESSGVPGVRSVSMRDMGTEMTPIPSQEPSRSVTPVSSTTPLRSPTSSVPSTPRRGGPGPIPMDVSNTLAGDDDGTKRELSEQELKLKARREIVELGVQLGKMNIAAWASKDERDKGNSGNKNSNGDEYAKRAAAWEEAEKSKHAARFKREEIRIQAWESQQKAKLEAEMRNIEAQIDQMRAHAQAKMVKKIALARQKSEVKKASVEARKEREAEKMAAKADYIRQTGQIPSSSPFVCCGWP